MPLLTVDMADRMNFATDNTSVFGTWWHHRFYWLPGHLYICDVSYRTRGLNSRHGHSYPFCLTEGKYVRCVGGDPQHVTI